MTPIDENASCTRTAAPGGRCAAHRGRRTGSSSRACRRCRAGRAGAASRDGPWWCSPITWSTTSANPSRADVRSNFTRVGSPAEQAALHEGSMAHQPGAASAERVRPGRSVERPWWLPISRASDPGLEEATASSCSIRPWSEVSQPGHVWSAAGQISANPTEPDPGLTDNKSRSGPVGRAWLHSAAHTTGQARWGSSHRDLVRVARGRLVGFSSSAWGACCSNQGARPGTPSCDLTSDPGGFPGPELHLWNPTSSVRRAPEPGLRLPLPAGTVLPPRRRRRCPGLGRAAGLVGVPDRRRLRGHQVRRPRSRHGAGPGVLAGLAYALSPRLLGAVGILSGEVLPSAVLPWVVLPLVLAVRAG